jgi:adenine deaminase
MSLVDRLRIARGEAPADLALRNAQLVNVISGEIYKTDVLVADGVIVALGDGYDAKNNLDLNGKYLAPGFIDAHVHIESSLCTPPEFARAVLPHGVTTVMTDPHEIANVLGLEGIRFMLERAKFGPLNIFVMASSCVPATHMETSGAVLEAEDLQGLLNSRWVPGLAEVMNYPGVIYGDEGMLDKLDLFKNVVVDGHCPGLRGKLLNAYVSAGIQSEHECTTVEEAQEKLRLGMTIFIREGTTTRNLKPLLPLITAHNHHHICFCTDDRIPASLIDEGSIDHLVRTAIQSGIDPIMAIRMGTINTARYFRLHDYGAIAPGKRADMIVFGDIQNLQVEMTFRNGELVAQNGKMVVDRQPLREIDLRSTMNIRLDGLDFRIPAAGDTMRVIGYIRDQVVTAHLTDTPKIVNGEAVVDIERDLLKIAVIERHRASGNIGKGFIKGFGLKRGAIAGTIAHDHHNLIVIGADDASMHAAVKAVVELRGGVVAVDGDTVLASLPLPVAGLMSEEPVDKVRHDYDAVLAAARSLGCHVLDPLMDMSFMGLEVIPALKLTDFGLVDVEQFQQVDLFLS